MITGHELLRSRYAHVDPVLLGSGLFRPRGSGKPVVGRADYLNTSFELHAPLALDHVALTLLLTLCSLAGQANAPMLEGVARPAALWQKMRCEGAASGRPTASWTGSLTELMREMGCTGNAGSMRTLVRARLMALADVRVSVSNKSTGALVEAAQLLAFVENENKTLLKIALCPHLSRSVLRSLGGHYVHVCLVTYRRINTGAGRVLHALLSNRVRETAHQQWKCGVEKLSVALYGEEGSAAAQRKRLGATRAAAAALVAQGWSIEEFWRSGSLVYAIRRGATDPKVLQSHHAPRLGAG